MKRHAEDDLLSWKNSPSRKPLVIRGARQVGKSFLVREFAALQFSNCIEINFERQSHLRAVFKTLHPQKIISSLELEVDKNITPGQTLLFFDEIQAAPEVLASLRYFYEELPELHVICAGSLLEFSLSDPHYSVPVGRIEYRYLGPMNFEEFLEAIGEQRLKNFIAQTDWTNPPPSNIHEKLLGYVRIFMMTGGMPSSILAYLNTKSFLESEKVKVSIVETYREDIGKYKGKVDGERIRRVFDAIPAMIGKKFKYTHIDREDSSKNLALALDLLCKALVVSKVHHSDGNGAPLKQEARQNYFKPLFLDIGLMLTCLGFTINDIDPSEDFTLVNEGAFAEQFVGQHLNYMDLFRKPECHYWLREHRSSNAEVDYIYSTGSHIIPIEVKAGKTGSLKSMQSFLFHKKRTFAIRICSQPLSLTNAKFSLANGSEDEFELLTLPFYLVGQMARLIERKLGIEPLT